MLPCLTKKYLGVECLGCGFQRAFLLVLKGEFAQAFYLYPPIYPLLGLSIFWVVHKIYPVSHARKITWGLAIFSIISILISYGFKHFI